MMYNTIDICPITGIDGKKLDPKSFRSHGVKLSCPDHISIPD